MSNELIQQTTKYSVGKCLTRQCKDCSGSYINKLTGYKLQCECKCHNKKTLEQRQAVGLECSNVHNIQPNQQPGGSLMADTSHISREPRIKSFAGNTEQIDINSIEWKTYDDNICPQCGQNHGYKLTAGSTIQDMISFLDRDSSKDI